MKSNALGLLIAVTFCIGMYSSIGCKKKDNSTVSTSPATAVNIGIYPPATPVNIGIDFWGTPRVGQDVYFRSVGIAEPGNVMTWDLGDGTIAHGTYCPHVYSVSGTFVVTLMLHNWPANRMAMTRTISIAPDYSFKGEGVPLMGNLLRFSTIFWQLPGSSYQWDFGNGVSLTDSAPSYTFPDSGNYRVSLTINNDKNHSNVQFVRIYRDPLYTHFAQGMKLWHRTRTTTYLGQETKSTLADTLCEIKYIDPLTLSIWNCSLKYNPDSSSGNMLYFSGSNFDIEDLTLYFDHVSGSAVSRYRHTYYFPANVGPGHHPSIYYNDLWISP